MVIEGWNDGKDRCSRIGSQRHIAQMNFVKRGLSYAKHQRSPFFLANIGCPLDKVLGQTMGNPGQCSHAAWQNNHSVGWIAAACNRRSDVRLSVLQNFRGTLSKQLLNQSIAPAESKLLGNDPQRAF